jgi:hypothetical protein
MAVQITLTLPFEALALLNCNLDTGHELLDDETESACIKLVGEGSDYESAWKLFEAPGDYLERVPTETEYTLLIRAMVRGALNAAREHVLEPARLLLSDPIFRGRICASDLDELTIALEAITFDDSIEGAVDNFEQALAQPK